MKMGPSLTIAVALLNGVPVASAAMHSPLTFAANTTPSPSSPDWRPDAMRAFFTWGWMRRIRWPVRCIPVRSACPATRAA